MSDIDHNEPFVKSLKTVSGELIRWPLTRDEVEDLGVGLMLVGWAIWCVVIRIVVLLTYPASVFAITTIARLDSKKSEKQIAESRELALKSRYRYAKPQPSQHNESET